MGAKACKKSNVRKPKRDEAKELAEKERAEKEAQDKAEADAEAERQAQEEAMRLTKLKEEEEAKRKAEEVEEARRLAEIEEARRRAEEEEKRKVEEEARRKAEEEARRLAEEEERKRIEEEERMAAEAYQVASVHSPPLSPRSQDASSDKAEEMTPMEKFDKLTAEDAASEATMSTQATGAVQKPKTKLHDMTQGATPHTARSLGNCDLTPVDQTAKNISVICGCDLGDEHDENKCAICKNMDLSDSPLLN